MENLTKNLIKKFDKKFDKKNLTKNLIQNSMKIQWKNHYISSQFEQQKKTNNTQKFPIDSPRKG
jgi:hypothetical protein